ncbi:MAG: hypothetical protein H6623_01575 [Bdellovibrionaceae bacterium]|nr:hypothetical protein [Pseudobdellovibrionaceae bacterium]
MMTKKIELKSLISLIYILVFVFLSQKIYAASIDQSNAIDSFTIDVARRAEQVKAAGHYPIDLKLSSQNLREVAATLLFNETSCNEKYIMHWNPKEDFPSLGLPHAIWFPRGVSYKYEEVFPDMWRFLYKRALSSGKSIPHFMQGKENPGLAWTRYEYENPDRETLADIMAMKNFLKDPQVLEWQAEFVAERTSGELYKMLAAASMEVPSTRDVVYKNLKELLSTDLGKMAVIDYVNFKGVGLKPISLPGASRQVNWGLRAVLENMEPLKKEYSKDAQYAQMSREEQVRYLFAKTAEKTLLGLANAYDLDADKRQVRLKYLERDAHGKALGGWAKRIDRTYGQDKLDIFKSCTMMADKANNKVFLNQDSSLKSFKIVR